MKEGGLWLIPELMPPSAAVVRVNAPDSDFPRGITNKVGPLATYSIWCGTWFNLLDNPIAKLRVYYTYLVSSGSWDTSLRRFTSGSVAWAPEDTAINWWKTGEGSSVTNYGSYVDAQGLANFFGVFPLGQYTMWMGLPSHRTKMCYGNSFGIIRLAKSFRPRPPTFWGRATDDFHPDDIPDESQLKALFLDIA